MKKLSALLIFLACVAPHVKAVNECDHGENAVNTHQCHKNAHCSDTPGSYMCICSPGYHGSGFDCVNLNECPHGIGATNMAKCMSNATCNDTEGSYTCICKDGLTGSGFDNDCSNYDECALDVHNCHSNASCNDTDGSYTCACNTGYVGNGTDCTNVNECKSSSPPSCQPNATCVDTEGSYTCACNKGYSGNATHCFNENECKLDTNDCHSNASCSDTEGSYNCACNTGYNGNGTHCSDEDECKLDTDECHHNATCSNTDGSYTCTCNTGYTGNGTNCTNINECTKNPHPSCHPKATCVDTEGSFTCVCNKGYFGNVMQCFNENECKLNKSDCHTNAKCSDTQGSYTCACNTGYTGNGTHCSNLNECKLNTSNCHSNANCSDTEGSYNCACNTGYDGNGTHCSDEDECALGTHNCHHNASCSNTDGSYTCSCNTGYTGNGTVCINLNECDSGVMPQSTHGCGDHATCTDTDGSYTCACDSGYSGDGYNCTDINECEDGSDECHLNATCVNKEGYYHCVCHANHAGNGTHCKEIEVAAGTYASQTVDQNQEETLNMTKGFPPGMEVNATILSVVTGGFPGVVIQNGPVHANNASVNVALYSSMEANQKFAYNWLVVDSDAYEDTDFQHGQVSIAYNVFEKCVNVTFSKNMSTIPAVVVSLHVTHSLNPFILDYSLVWTEDVTVTGFRACVHEAVLFSGEHKAHVSYVAVSTNVSNYGSITEVDMVNFPVGDIPDANETYVEPFCKKILLKNRYPSPPGVFVTAENVNGSSGEQVAWIKAVTGRHAYVCTKNTFDDPSKRLIEAKVSMLITGANSFHVCNGKVPPTNLDCFADNSTKSGYRFDCWEECDNDIVDSHLCANDKGKYHSKCYMQRETCKMYGKKNVESITSITCPAYRPKPPCKCSTELEYVDKVAKGYCDNWDDSITTFPTFCAIEASNGGKCPSGVSWMFGGASTTVTNDSAICQDAKTAKNMQGFQSGMLKQNWTQNTNQKNIYCQNGTLDLERFGEYSDILVAVSAVVDGGGYSGQTFMLNSISTWTENVDRVSGTFTVCYSYTGKQDFHDVVTRNKVEIAYVVYQKNIHRRLPYTEGDQVSLASWKRGTQCVKIQTKISVDNTSKFIVSIHRREKQPYHTPLRVWVEVNEDNHGDFRFCARGDEIFGAQQKDASINWLHVKDVKLVNDDSLDMQNTFNILPKEFPNEEKWESGRAEHKDHQFENKKYRTQTANMVSVKNFVSDGTFATYENMTSAGKYKSSRSTAFNTWIQLLSNGNRPGVAYHAVWTGAPMLASEVLVVNFVDAMFELREAGPVYKSSTAHDSGEYIT